MKRIILPAIAAVVIAASAAKADPYDGSGVYSVATPNCVPAVHALFWYDPGYRMFRASLNALTNADRVKAERALGPDTTPACWLGKVVKAVGLPHRKLYLPSESKKIRRWFEQNTNAY